MSQDEKGQENIGSIDQNTQKSGVISEEIKELNPVRNSSPKGPPGAPSAGEISNGVKEKLTKCEKERDEYLDGWKRTKADFINYKKEETERLSALFKFSNEGLISELLTVLDSFNLGLTILKNDEPAQKGMFLIRSQLEDLLKKYGLQIIQIKEKQKFDPMFHEAISEIDSSELSGTIIEEVERGYILNGKVIRPTKVKVAK